MDTSFSLSHSLASAALLGLGFRFQGLGQLGAL